MTRTLFGSWNIFTTCIARIAKTCLSNSKTHLQMETAQYPGHTRISIGPRKASVVQDGLAVYKGWFARDPNLSLVEVPSWAS
ncbi:unnamed protein product [Aspergillus oryzae var. brunneus]|uniref:Unnamed protein product n=1 Tax=Aspergillus oryzae var. brunneus TaxID=332754 RepID=A0ABQ6KV95_ASPOZ|nr:unnamed protein product [Aspergillus oryzae]GMG46436.1 unnamed protein product [Aspergillus oryzae var. brunneus]